MLWEHLPLSVQVGYGNAVSGSLFVPAVSLDIHQKFA
jgi:hypothetical protein